MGEINNYDREYTSATCYVCRDLWNRIDELERENFAQSDKIARLESTVKGQEETIEQLERIIRKVDG